MHKEIKQLKQEIQRVKNLLAERRNALRKRTYVKDLESISIKRQVIGAFVYAWLDGDWVFYVGKGLRLDRALISGCHNEIAERLRKLAGADFRVRILDGLTEDEAFKLEKQMLSLFRPVANQKLPKGCVLECTVMHFGELFE